MSERIFTFGPEPSKDLVSGRQQSLGMTPPQTPRKGPVRRGQEWHKGGTEPGPGSGHSPSCPLTSSLHWSEALVLTGPLCKANLSEEHRDRKLTFMNHQSVFKAGAGIRRRREKTPRALQVSQIN